jgi:hypothetical protein
MNQRWIFIFRDTVKEALGYERNDKWQETCRKQKESL